MGYDVSYHPVDSAFFRDRLFPIVRGEQSGDELFARAAPVPMYLRKLIEALRDAARRGLAFIEATEIYSGPYGKMN